MSPLLLSVLLLWIADPPARAGFLAEERPPTLVPLVTESEPEKSIEVRIRFIGNAAFEISDGTTTLLTDFPYHSGAFGYMKYHTHDVRPTGRVVCLVTHGHDDHFDLQAFAATGWGLIGPSDVTRLVDPSRVLDAGLPIGAVQVRAIPTDHAGVGHNSYRVTWGNRTFYFTGDTETADELLATGETFDVLFVTPWLLADLKRRGVEPPGTSVIVHHHRPGEKLPPCPSCRVPVQGDVLKLSATVG